MARRADLADFDQKRIAVAIIKNIFHKLKMPGGHAFVPVFIARTRPETGFSFLNGAFDRLEIHIRQHQDFFAAVILDNRRNQTLIIKL